MKTTEEILDETRAKLATMRVVVDGEECEITGGGQPRTAAAADCAGLQAGAVDFYALMSPYEFRNTQERADYKKLAMRLFFGGSPAKITSAFFHELRRNGMELDYSKEEVEDAVGLAQARMFSAVGESIGSEVFLHEGAIYLMLLDRLLGMGMRVVSVYDEFISDNPRLKEICEELLPKVAAEYRERWC